MSEINSIRINDKTFEPVIPESEILAAIKQLADQINEDMQGLNPLFICVLNGAFMFAADLMKNINLCCEITFIRLKSYSGTNTEGNVKEIHGLIEDISGKDIIIIEDIIDTGHTIHHLINRLKKEQPRSIKTASLLFKPDALQLDVKPDYVALKIPNDFIVGYGLDYDGKGRNFRDIYRIKN